MLKLHRSVWLRPRQLEGLTVVSISPYLRRYLPTWVPKGGRDSSALWRPQHAAKRLLEIRVQRPAALGPTVQFPHLAAYLGR